MSDTDSVVSIPLTPHLDLHDLSPLEADIITGKTAPADPRWSDEQGNALSARLKPYATKVLAAIAACHGRTQAVVLSAAAICVLRCADMLMGDPWTPGVVTEGKAISLVAWRGGYCLVAKGRPEGTLFGLTVLSEKDTHFFPISDGTANAKVDADIVSQLQAAHAQSVVAGEAAGVSQAALAAQVSTLRKGSEFERPIAVGSGNGFWSGPTTPTLTIDKFRNGLMEHMSKNRHASTIVAYACSRSLQDLEASLGQLSGPSLTDTAGAGAVLRINGVEVRPDNDLTLGSLMFKRETADSKPITPMEPVSA